MHTNDADAFNDLGSRMLERGLPREAASCFKKAVDIDPGFAEAFFNLGLSLRQQGDIPAALQCLAHALRLKDDFFQAHFMIGNILLDAGEPEKASARYRAVLAMVPGFADAHYNLGNAFKAMGDLKTAAECYARAVEVRPDFVEALNNLGLTLKDAGRLDEAVQCYTRALGIKPGMKEAHFNLGIARQLDGRFQEGIDHYRKAFERDPHYTPARWLHDLSLPILYRHPEEVLIQRRRFERNLRRLVRETDLSTADQRKRALDGVASTTHFFLQYQGEDDLELQSIYGEFVVRVMAANFPDWSRPRGMPPLAPGERVRVGYVSSFMRSHTVGHFLLGWLEGHHREAIELCAYHVGDVTDQVTGRLKSRVDRFHQIGGRLEKAAARIVADDLHVLVYTDIGMNALATQLAGLRLAPVQCKGWGHPVTTGLPTVDYYLSSDLMEPPGAQAHYSEKLIRLPNLALNFTPPRLPRHPKTRDELGLRKDAVIYLSSQSLFKYLPRHDEIYPRIAKEVPNARFVFIADSHPGVTRLFVERLARAFACFGLSFDAFCRIQPRLGFEDFLSLNLASDVLLDTLEWSGGKTTLEALSCGVPVVTLPGRFMRGRHAHAMLRMMGVNGTIANDKDEYIRIATALGRDRNRLSRAKAQVAQHRSRLYFDRSFIDVLEDFLVDAVARGFGSRARTGAADGGPA